MTGMHQPCERHTEDEKAERIIYLTHRTCLLALDKLWLKSVHPKGGYAMSACILSGLGEQMRRATMETRKALV